MATVVHKPGDKRWGEIGEAFGKAVYEREQKKKAEEAERERKKAYDQALSTAEVAIATEEDFNSGRVYKEMAGALDSAGASDQLDDMMEMIISARAEREKQKTKEVYVKNLPKDSPARQRLQGAEGSFDVDTADKMSQFEKRLQPEKDASTQGERALTAYDAQSGEEKKVFVPKSVKPGQEDTFIRKEYGQQWTTTKPAPAEDSSKNVQERKVTASTKDGKTREVFIPESVPPEGIDSYVKKTYGKEWDLAQGPKAPTTVNAKDIRDVEAELVNRGVNPAEATAKERAGARNVMNHNQEATKLLQQSYGKDIVADPMGGFSVRSWRGEDARIKYSLAQQEVDDHLYEGMSPNDAAALAEEKAEIGYKTGEWLPPRVRNSNNPAEVEAYLDDRGINDPELVRYVDAANFLKQYQQDPSSVKNPEMAKEALKVVLKVRNPNASEQEIEAEVERTFGAQ